MSLNKAQFKALEREIQVMVHAGVILDQDQATDYFCARRKRVMKKQRASRKNRRGWA